ncbi:MAG TPA: histidinol dehydrogenase, partial [Acidimicrobiales bacterium]|nr:histidinol dehydrogenase [Acidimicrobiales bacterium]
LLTRLDLRGATGDLRARLPAPKAVAEGPVQTVRDILAQVKAGGDQAVVDLTRRFDAAVPSQLRVPDKDLRAARAEVPEDLLSALEAAARSIRAFHEAEMAAHHGFEHGSPSGIVTREVLVPVHRAGCYVPGGRAPLASTVLMTAIPALVAGVEEVAVCCPPGPGGRVPAQVLAAAAVAGVDEVYAMGGAQAIGALAYGTDSVPAVEVIVGPGNVYVATAQRLVAEEGVVGVPSAFAGPSEVVVVADGSAPAEYAALDLVVQAEHGPDGLAWLVCWSEDVASAVEDAVERIVSSSPRQREVTATLEQGGWSVLVDGPERAMDVCNVVAPEHLELITADPAALVPLVRSAGAVFCGPWAPASVGDYIAGPSHVLPTARSARFSSALGTQDFLKRLHIVTVDQAALARVAPHVATIAQAEGLAAHAGSVLCRAGPATPAEAVGAGPVR